MYKPDIGIYQNQLDIDLPHGFYLKRIALLSPFSFAY